MYKPRRGGAAHVWRRWAPGANALKMQDNQSSVRDCGIAMLSAGQSRGMWDGWQVCGIIIKCAKNNRNHSILVVKYRVNKNNSNYNCTEVRIGIEYSKCAKITANIAVHHRHN